TGWCNADSSDEIVVGRLVAPVACAGVLEGEDGGSDRWANLCPELSALKEKLPFRLPKLYSVRKLGEFLLPIIGSLAMEAEFSHGGSERQTFGHEVDHLTTHRVAIAARTPAFTRLLVAHAVLSSVAIAAVPFRLLRVLAV